LAAISARHSTTVTVTRLKNCYRETSINDTEKLHIILLSAVLEIENVIVNAKFLEMGHCQVLTRNSSGDEIAKRDLMIHTGYRGLARGVAQPHAG